MSISDNEILIREKVLDLRMDFVAIHSFQDLITILPDIIATTDLISKNFEKMSSKEKRDVVIHVVNSFIDIPVLPEWLEEKAIGRLINIIVGSFNSQFGKDWVNKIIQTKQI